MGDVDPQYSISSQAMDLRFESQVPLYGPLMGQRSLSAQPQFEFRPSDGWRDFNSQSLQVHRPQSLSPDGHETLELGLEIRRTGT